MWKNKFLIDVNFDFQEECTAKYKCNRFEVDSDRWSPTLQEYHRVLWSKKLPNGKEFKLEKISQNRLFHKSELGKFILSSDRAVTTFKKKLKDIVNIVPNYMEFNKLTDTIGGILI